MSTVPGRFKISPQPIPYQGSKRSIAREILKKCPLNISRLVEPFCGSAAVSIACASEKRASYYWMNDAHEPLIKLLHEIIFHPDEISDKYSELWSSQIGREREYFTQIRNRFNNYKDPADFLYLLARCVKAAIRYNSNGEFNNTPDNRRKGARPSEMRRRISCVSELLKGRVQLTAWDYKKVLNECRQGDLVYMDPPYQGVSGKRDQRYLPKVDHEEFSQELKKLNSRNIMFIVSYDGRTGTKSYGNVLPSYLNLTHMEIFAGRSTQSTLLGGSDVTYESLYLSPYLTEGSLRESGCFESQTALW